MAKDVSTLEEQLKTLKTARLPRLLERIKETERQLLEAQIQETESNKRKNLSAEQRSLLADFMEANIYSAPYDTETRQRHRVAAKFPTLLENLPITVSPRERQIIDILAEGKNFTQAAKIVGCSITTIRYGFGEVYQKIRKLAKLNGIR